MMFEVFQKTLIESLNEEMKKVAEPVIQHTLKEVERRMREQVAARLIGLIEENFDMQMDSRRIVITLRQVKEK
jgi:hypothetical protein